MTVKKNSKFKINVDTKESKLTGLQGFLETLLRKFRIASFLIALIPVYIIAALIMAISVLPGVYLFTFLNELSAEWLQVFHYLALAIGIVLGYMLYGFTVIFVTPVFNFLIPMRLKPFRGPYYSIRSVPWYVHNALLYLVRYTFLEFVTPTPVNILFYRMMGMKIGKGVHINTTNISDARLIEIEDKVTIGGSAHIICHYATKGYLVVSRVKIKRGATLGLKSTIMGDVEIGENALIAPHEVVFPKSRIPSNYNNSKGKLKIEEQDKSLIHAGK